VVLASAIAVAGSAGDVVTEPRFEAVPRAATDPLASSAHTPVSPLALASPTGRLRELRELRLAVDALIDAAPPDRSVPWLINMKYPSPASVGTTAAGKPAKAGSDGARPSIDSACGACTHVVVVVLAPDDAAIAADGMVPATIVPSPTAAPARRRRLRDWDDVARVDAMTVPLVPERDSIGARLRLTAHWDVNTSGPKRMAFASPAPESSASDNGLSRHFTGRSMFRHRSA
jgi:hypothetical protein